MPVRTPKKVTVPGAQPTPDPIIARPVTVPARPSRKKKSTKTVQIKTKIAAIIDKSGSMCAKATDVIGDYNNYIKEQKESAEAATIDFSLTLFDTNVQKVFIDRPIARVPDLTPSTYPPYGMTALNDALGQTLAELDKTVDSNTRVLVVVMTDGLENSSREYTKAGIRQMIKDREDRGNWTFVFLGAGIDAFAEGGAIGVAVGNTLSHDPNNYGEAFKSLSIGTQCYTGNPRLRGTKSFFRDSK